MRTARHKYAELQTAPLHCNYIAGSQDKTTGWGRISGIMLEPISETIYAVDTISQLPMAC